MTTPPPGKHGMELRFTLTAPYVRCGRCEHPGPPERPVMITITTPPGDTAIVLIPHRRYCPAPNPYGDTVPAANINLGDGDGCSWD